MSRFRSALRVAAVMVLVLVSVSAAPAKDTKAADEWVDEWSTGLQLTPAQYEQARHLIDQARRNADAVDADTSLDAAEKRVRVDRIEAGLSERLYEVLTPSQQARYREREGIASSGGGLADAQTTTASSASTASTASEAGPPVSELPETAPPRSGADASGGASSTSAPRVAAVPAPVPHGNVASEMPSGQTFPLDEEPFQRAPRVTGGHYQTELSTTAIPVIVANVDPVAVLMAPVLIGVAAFAGGYRPVRHRHHWRYGSERCPSGYREWRHYSGGGGQRITRWPVISSPPAPTTTVSQPPTTATMPVSVPRPGHQGIPTQAPPTKPGTLMPLMPAQAPPTKPSAASVYREPSYVAPHPIMSAPTSVAPRPVINTPAYVAPRPVISAPAYVAPRPVISTPT